MILALVVFTSCGTNDNPKAIEKDASREDMVPNGPFAMVLGTVQDGGYPQAGCKKECCKPPWSDPEKRRWVSCIAIIDPVSNERWIIDATPDLREQIHMLNDFIPTSDLGINGIFLTHAHIGHYTGLIHLGREVMGTDSIKVYAMDRLRNYLIGNGPWSQLVNLQNISLRSLKSDSTVRLNARITITPFSVPHRDEYSETVGFRVEGPERSIIFIPDIDKWEKWEQDILALIRKVDIALLDGTFYDIGELPGRDMSDIPHPFIVESMKLFNSLEKGDRREDPLFYI